MLITALIVFFFLPKKAAAPTALITKSEDAQVSVSPSISATWPQNEQINPKVLMYHHIGPLPPDADDIRRGLTVSAENFDAGLKFLKDGNYNVVTLQKMYQMVAQGEDVSKTVVLTFDDGYDDNYVHALPILQKYGFTGTFFIISGKIGQAEYMTQDQIKKLVSVGNEIGSHTVNHLDLATLPATNLKSEVEDSKSTLEKLIGEPVVSFCYPSGKFSPDVEKAVAAAGYKIAVTTQKGAPFLTNNPFEVPRYRINPSTSLNSILD